MTDRIVFANDLPYAGISNNPLDSLRDILAFSSRDWSESRDTAWIYGVVFGWDVDRDDFDDECDAGEDAYPQLAERFGWPDAQVERLKRLHANFERMRKATS